MEMINSLKCFKIDPKHLEILDRIYQVFSESKYKFKIKLVILMKTDNCVLVQ